MNIQLRCEAILSKKLEKICEPGEPIEIRLSGIKGNRAEALLRISTQKGATLEDISKIGETNIGFKVIGVGEEAPNVEDDPPVHLLFTRDAQITPSTPAPLTIGDPNVSQSPSPPAVKKQPIVDNTVYIKVANNQKENSPIMNYAELMEELMKVPGIDSPMPEMKPQNGKTKLTRQEAEEFEKKILGLPRLTRPVYIGNEASGSVMINDLNQPIQLGEVVDFSKLPARKLIDSRELRGLLLQNILKFCTEDEYIAYINTANVNEGPQHDTLPTGSRKEMEALMELGYIPEELSKQQMAKPVVASGSHRDTERLDLEDDDDTDFDEEMEILKQLPSEPSLPTPSINKVNPKASSSVKPIRRVHSS